MGGMTLDELEASLASPVIATPPALLRPNVGAAAREAASSRGRGLLQRNSASGSFVSSRWAIAVTWTEVNSLLVVYRTHYLQCAARSLVCLHPPPPVINTLMECLCVCVFSASVFFCPRSYI